MSDAASDQSHGSQVTELRLLCAMSDFHTLILTIQACLPKTEGLKIDTEQKIMVSLSAVIYDVPVSLISHVTEMSMRLHKYTKKFRNGLIM